MFIIKTQHRKEKLLNDCDDDDRFLFNSEMIVVCCGTTHCIVVFLKTLLFMNGRNEYYLIKLKFYQNEHFKL